MRYLSFLVILCVATFGVSQQKNAADELIGAHVLKFWLTTPSSSIL